MRASLPSNAVSAVLNVTTSGSNTGSGAPSPRPTGTVNNIEHIRAVVRQNLEEGMYSNLINSADEVSCAARLAVLAWEMEEELHELYSRPDPSSAEAGGSGGGAEMKLSKKEYHTHYLMLVRNLKHAYNGPLVS